MRTLTLRALAALVAAVGLAVGAAAPAGAAPRPQPAQNFQDMDCTEKVTVIIRVELWSSYLLPGGAGERYRTGDIDSGVGYNHHWRLEMACKWTANRTAGFYFAKATVWAISERDHSEQSIGTIRTPAWGLPCIDTSIPAGL
jgi:hypothetical protein